MEEKLIQNLHERLIYLENTLFHSNANVRNYFLIKTEIKTYNKVALGTYIFTNRFHAEEVYIQV